MEQATRAQSNSRLWPLFRAGRVTASMVCTVCHTDPSQPAASCIKGICYPDRHLTTPAMRWGSKHEKCAKAAYVTRMMAEHVNFSVRDSGFVIPREYPEIGASPDGITWCDCHGEGILEVKCLGRGHYQGERRSDLPWPEGSTIGQMLDSTGRLTSTGLDNNFKNTCATGQQV